MNSDKQGRAMCACGSSGAAPGAEPAAAAPQCRCRTAPRAPSPAQNITAAIAAAEGVPAYVVFSNATLADMAARQPKSEYELLGVRGVGEAKARRYGAEFVDCIRDYLEEN